MTGVRDHGGAMQASPTSTAHARAETGAVRAPIPPDEGCWNQALPVVGLSGSVLECRGGALQLDGIGSYTQSLERELAALGVSVARVLAPPARRWLRRSPPPPPPSFSWPFTPSLAVTALTGLSSPGTAAVEAAIGLYHATDYLVPRLRRTPVVATVYDAIPLRAPQWANSRLRRIKNWLLRSSVDHADLVIAISQAAVAELVEHFGIPEARIRVVPLGIDPQWLEAPPPARVRQTLAAYGLVPGYFLFVGTLQPRKNLDTLLAAYDRLPPRVAAEHQLVIVGKYGWNAESLREDLRRRAAGQRCVWLNYVPAAELRELYEGAGALVFPSLAEGFGLPVLEALGAGLPVVASDLPVLHEVAGGLAEFVPPLDADAMAAAMNRALEQSKSGGASEDRRGWARGMDWRSCARRTIGVYREVL
jgi:glycosyltransferase involved in cell wall biosynthesis